jgi:hypothetical protein
MTKVIRLCSGFLFLTAFPLWAAILTNGSFEAGFTGYTRDAFLDFNAAVAGNPSYASFLAAQTDPSRTTVADSNAVVTSQTTTFDGGGTPGPAVLPTDGNFLAFLSNETSAGNGSLTGSSISQTFTIPVGTSTFSFDIALLNDDTSPSADFNDFGGLALLFGSTVVDEYNIDLVGMANANVQLGVARGGFLNSTPWESVGFDTSALQGETVTLVGYVTQVGDNTVESRLVLDNLALSGSIPTVPEPGSLALGAGALLLFLLLLRPNCKILLNKHTGNSK